VLCSTSFEQRKRLLELSGGAERRGEAEEEGAEAERGAVSAQSSTSAHSPRSEDEGGARIGHACIVPIDITEDETKLAEPEGTNEVVISSVRAS
jgi:hypothetical protein